MAERYGSRQIALHWIIVALVAVQFLLHEAMSKAFEVVQAGGDPVLSPLVGAHVFVGFVVFVLTLARLQMRLSHGAPPPPEQEPAPLRALSQAVHWAFYGLLVALPVSGAVAWFRGSGAAGDAHEIMRAVLLGLIALHVAGAMVHQFVWKTDVLRRMRPRKD